MAQTKIKAGLFEGIIGNGTDGYFLMSNGDGTMTWSSIVINPTITSIAYPGSVTAADPAGGETITVTGTGFKTGATVTVGGTAAPAVSYVSATQITFTTPAKAAGDYDIVVTNTDTGSATYINGISYNGIPSWTTAAGSLGTFASNTTISTITLQATEPDAGTITFNITNGALPTGLSLTGANIDGTTSLETADTLYTFTVTATDDESQSTPRTFTITVQKQFISTDNFTINTYTGNGSTQSIEGKIGTATDFNGSSSKITISSGANTPIDLTQESFSISMWFNTSTISSDQALISRWGTTAGTDRAILLNIRSSDGKITLLEASGSTNYSFVSNTVLSANTWYHFVYTRSGTESSLYIDGTLDRTDSRANSINSGGTIPFDIGHQYGGNKWFNGKIDQVRIFNKELSSSEVTTLYGESNTSSTKSKTDIFADGSGVALYEFEKGAIDTGGTSGYIGGGGMFDGTTSQIRTIGNPIPSTSSVFSVSFWFQLDNTNTNNHIFSIFDNVAGTNKLLIRSLSSGNFQAGIYSASGNNFITTTQANFPYTTGVWYHLVYISTSSGNNEFWIDGTQIATSTGVAANTTSSSIPITMGGRGDFASSTTERFEGKLDQVRIFNKALSSSEVTTLYGETSASATKSTADIFNDGSGVALYELEGNANDSSGNTLPLDIDDIDFANKKVFNPTDMDAYTSPGCAFGDNGNRLYAGDEYLDGIIREYALATPYDISTAASTATGSKNLDESYMYGFKIVSSTRIFATENNSVIEYQMSTPWSISTATSTLNKFTKANMGSALSNSNFTAWDFNSDGTKLIASYQNNAGTQAAFEIFNLSTAYTITGVDSATPDSSSGWINVSYDGHRGLYWSENEDQVFYIGLTGIAHQFGFATAGDASTITLTKTRSMGYGNLGGFEWYPDQNILLTASETNQNYVQASWSQGDYNGTATNVSYAYDGTPTNVSFVGASFQPDLVWIKQRTGTANNHQLYDSVRGTTARLYPNLNNVESTDPTGLTAFNNYGFTLGNSGNVNDSSSTFAAWTWKAGGNSNTYNIDGTGYSTASAAGLNTGSLTPIGASINTESGISIVKVNSGSSTADVTVSHGLGVKPSFVIFKKLTSEGGGWFTWHKNLPQESDYLYLNGNQAISGLTQSSNAWGNQSFSANNISFRAGWTVETNRDVIIYSFADIAGYQQTGSYTGTGSSNTITTGFKPRFVMIKATNNASDWYMIDSIRPNNKFLISNGNGSEYTASDTHTFTSTGFTLSGSSYNNSGYNWIYLAIA